VNTRIAATVFHYVGEGVDTEAPIWIAILGPVGVWRDMVEITDVALRQRSLLGLTRKANNRAAIPDIIDALWPGNPPPNIVNVIHKCTDSYGDLLTAGSRHAFPGRLIVRNGAE